MTTPPLVFCESAASYVSADERPKGPTVCIYDEGTVGAVIRAMNHRCVAAAKGKDFAEAKRIANRVAEFESIVLESRA